MHGEQEVRVRIGDRPSRRGRVMVAVALALAGAATGLATATAATGRATPLFRFFPRAGEQTGFVPTGRPQVIRSLAALIRLEAKQGVAVSQADRLRLKREGFRLRVGQRMKSLTNPAGDDGLASVTEFGSHRAARSALRLNVRRAKAYQAPGAAITPLRLPGIPGLVAFTATGPGAGGASNAYMAWGRCLIFIGDTVAAPGSSEGPVRAAVAAVYARTGTHCP